MIPKIILSFQIRSFQETALVCFVVSTVLLQTFDVAQKRLSGQSV